MSREGEQSNIPETPAIEPRSRGVLDAPPSRGMTAASGATAVSEARAVSLLCLPPIRPQKHPRRAVHHFFGALGGRGGGDLEHEGQEQRGLAHLDELRSGEVAVIDRAIAGLAMRGEIAR